MRFLYWVSRTEPRVATLALQGLKWSAIEKRDLIWAETPNHAIQVARMTKLARNTFHEHEKSVYAAWNEINKELDK